MAQSDGTQRYGVSAYIETKDLDRQVEEIEAGFSQIGETAERSGKKVEQAFEEAGKGLRDTGKAMQEVAEQTERTVTSQERMSTVVRENEASHTSLKQRLKEITATMAEMRVAGQQDTDAYRQLADEAGVLKDAIADTNEEIKNIASDTRGFDVAIQGAQAASGAFSALVGTMELAGMNTEEAAEAQRTLQSAIAVTTGLQSVQTAVQSQSALMIGIGAMQKKALAAAEALDTAAKGKNIIATTAATAAQAAFNFVAKMNPYVLLATALVTVVGALWAFSKGNKEAAKAEAERAQKAKEAQEAIEKEKAAIDSINSSVAQQMGVYSKLRAEWLRLKTAQEKNAFIKNNKSAFNQLGVEIKNVTSAESFLASNTDNVVRAFMLRAKAAAQAAKAAELWRKYLDESDKQKNYATYKGARAGDKWGNLSDDEKNSLRNRYGRDLYAAGLLDTGGLTDKGAKALNKERGRTASQAQSALNKQAEQNKKQILDSINRVAKDNADTEKQISEILGQYGSPGGTSSKGGSTVNDTLKKNAEDAQRLSEAQIKANRAAVRAKIDAELETRQYEINTLAEGGERTRKQIELNYAKEKEAIRRGIEDTIKANEDAARELWEAQNPDADEKGQTWQNTGRNGKSFGLTDEQQKMFKAREVAAKASYERELDNEDRLRNQSMLDYLKAYGSMEQQRLAIAQEYEQKIADLRKAGASEFEIASVEEEMKAKLKELNVTDIFNRIDWSNVFTDLASHTKEYLVGVRDQLQDLIGSGSLKSIEDIEKVQERLDALNAEIGKKGGILDFEGSRAREHNRRVDAADTAENNRQNALREEAQAFNALAKLQDAGAGAQELAVAEARLAKAREDVKKATDKAKAAEDAAKRTSAQAVADWFSDAGEFITEQGIDQLPGLADKLGLGDLGAKLGAGLSGFNNAAGAAADFASGNYIGAAIKGISAIADFGSALGVSFGADYSGWQEAVDKYSGLCDVWSSVLDDQKEVVAKAHGVYDAMAALNDSNETRQKMLDAQIAMGEARLGSGASAGSHSIDYRMWKGSYKSAYGRNWKDVAGQIGISGMSDLLHMNSEQLKNIRAEYSDLWAVMDGEFRTILENIIEYGEQAEQMAEDVNNKITMTSFDGLRDNFLDTLTDMESSAEDFSKSFEDMMFKAMVNSFVLDDEFDKWLENWQESYKNAVVANDKAMLEQLRKDAEKMRQDKVNERNQIAADMGIGSTATQTATASGIQSITADQGNQLVGRITAIQIAVEHQTALSEELTANARTMAQQITTGLSLVEENNSLTQRCARHLETIAEYTSVLPNMNQEITKLRTITENKL